jgi:hypothetical protein
VNLDVGHASVCQYSEKVLRTVGKRVEELVVGDVGVEKGLAVVKAGKVICMMLKGML